MNVAEIERAMAAERPFGDDVHILGLRRDYLTAQLADLAAGLPEAADLLGAMTRCPEAEHRRLLTETTLRSAIAHAHRQVLSGVPRGRQRLRVADCAAIFSTAARYLERGGTGVPLHDGTSVRLGSDRRYGWIWTDEHPDDIYGRAFRELIETRYRLQPSTPDASTVETLTTGARLLGELLPAVAPSALHHAHTVACVPTPKAFFGSSSRPDLGGVLFLRESLGSPWWVAEHLLHESIHLKLYDLFGADTLIAAEGQYVERPVLTPWNPSLLSGANRWHAWRVLAALHVYVHVALLSTVAERRAAELEDSYGPITDMLDARRAVARAHHLGAQLRAHQQCWDTLGPLGQQLAGWLRSLLDALDPDTDPAGGTLHLYLDRYHRETDRVKAMLADGAASRSAFRDALAALAREEVSATRAILTDMDQHRQVATLAAGVVHFTETELADHYPEIREIIECCLLNASLDGHRLSESGDADAKVGAMVERSSDTLYALSAGIPAPVAAAKRRAVHHCLPNGCSDDIGRLTAVQVAHLRVGARVLEIKCGVGILTAWLVAGLGRRTDVKILSAESDPALGAVARDHPWPSYVYIETANAETVLARQRDVFDLILADASAATTDTVAPLVDAARSGGMLIIYNTGAATQTALLRTILEHDHLVAAQIDWATGLLIAAKRR